MDSLLLAQWTKIKDTPGLLRNPAYDVTQRRLLGKSGMVAQFNVEHIKTKRPATLTAPSSTSTASPAVAAASPTAAGAATGGAGAAAASPAPAPAAAVIQVKRAFNPDGFHFNKCNKKEIVAWFREGKAEDGTLKLEAVWPSVEGGLLVPEEEAASCSHALFVNANPLTKGHSLFVPFLRDCHPQALSEQLLLAALRFHSLSTRPDCKLGFNSLGAWASVNHCHLHVTYTQDIFPGNKTPLERAAKKLLGQWAVAGAASAAAQAGGDAEKEEKEEATAVQVLHVHGWPSTGFLLRVGAAGSLAVAAAVEQAPSVTAGDGLIAVQEPVDDADCKSIWHSAPWFKAEAEASTAAADASASSSSSSPAQDTPRDSQLLLLAKITGRFVEHLQDSNIAYNLLVADRGTAVYILPRQHQRGGGAAEGKLAAALAEISGLGIFYSQEDLEGTTEGFYAGVLHDFCLSEGQMEGLQGVLLKMVQEAVSSV